MGLKKWGVAIMALYFFFSTFRDSDFKAIKLNNKTISAYILYTTNDTICNINVVAKFKGNRNQSRNIEKFDAKNYKSKLDRLAI